MRLGAEWTRSIRPAQDRSAIAILDQTLLPWRVVWIRLAGLEDTAEAIAAMRVRGAPLIGAVGAFGLALALREDASDEALEAAATRLIATRPTAVNLAWAVARVAEAVRNRPRGDRFDAAWAEASAIADEDAACCEAIGRHGLPLIAGIAERKGGDPVNILTHCNAGWLATVDWGTATAPIYRAHDAGIPVHVWVDETRPRNQGAALTAFELGGHGVPHTVVADNAGGHLMRRGEVDLVLVGTDRVARNGDVANKIGTYLKALAAADTGVPFWVALPFSTIDWSLASGELIPIEERSEAEVTEIAGLAEDGAVRRVRVVSPGSRAANPAFDVTPARLVTGLITERGRCAASEAGLLSLYPEKA
ncbi:S-methyl-5-thioribose-1-phosphate isomerase [Elioraea thermophila]|uniref:S-methyl-5-thioribose-1-phosphate isomerase n=1 Tax=Elioraea thermophila TaxID=2185104 RepID=UPI000DF2A90F|nr:S-methyl-5-thioribose-1-phosphate isomerase [Elioraea thermophila]